MTINKMELRFENMNLTSSDEGLKVSGYVNRTNQWSQPLGTKRIFVERIEPGAFRKALQNGNEVHFYAEHDPAKILATTRNDSLNLREDDNGLFMEATIAPTSWGQDYHTLIKEGIIKNMSFGMKVLKEAWSKRSDGISERSISDLYLAEVSAVRNPAYAQSTIAARSIEIVEDVEPMKEKQEVKREITLEEQLEAKRSYLNGYKKLALLDKDDKNLKNIIGEIEGEIRKMEAQLNTQTATVETEQKEQRALTAGNTTPGQNAGWQSIPTNIIKTKVKKMNGKHSLVARTNIIVAKQTQIDAFSEDGEFPKENMFVNELSDLPLKDFSGEKINIKGQRAGYGIEMSKQLLNDNDIEIQERNEERLISKIEDGLNFSMLTSTGSMENLNDDTSVSSILVTANVAKISLIDVLTLIGKLNCDYREGAVFKMHTDVFNHILTNVEFKDHLEFAIDEFSGKKLYHLLGYPILVNDNHLGQGMTNARILFGNLGEGYTTLVSEDSFNMVTIDWDTDSYKKASVKNIMDIYAGGRVTNKDCFVRLDVATVAPASHSEPEEVENPMETASIQSIEPKNEIEVILPEEATAQLTAEQIAYLKEIIVEGLEDDLKAQGIEDKPTSIEILPVNKTAKFKKAKGE